MKNIIKLLMCTAILVTPAIILAADNIEDGCKEVLHYSARNYSINEAESGVATKVYEQNCQDDSVKSGTNFNVGLETVIKAVPVKFNLGSGSTEERTKHFCKTFDSEYKSNKNYYQSNSIVVASSTNAWLECKKLASKGAIFRPQVSKTQVLIDIVKVSSNPISINGVVYDNKHATCTVPNTDESNVTVLADENTRKTLNDQKAWVITCKRSPEQPEDKGKDEAYTDFVLSVTTSDGAFFMPVPADGKIHHQWASDLKEQQILIANQVKSNIEDLQKLNTLVTDLKNQITELKNLSNQQKTSIENLNTNTIKVNDPIELMWPMQSQCIFPHGKARSNSITTDTCGHVHTQLHIRRHP